MGMCLDDFGRLSIEVRRESFIVHSDYGYTPDGDHTPDTDHHGKHWRTAGHPEFLLTDLDDLIAALQDAKDYLVNRKPDRG